MIINGQHNIAASKELQLDGCSEDRRRVLEKWDAVVVWDLDLVRLTKIVKFYNSINPLNHVQPMWENQIVSSRNIWISNGRPWTRLLKPKFVETKRFKILRHTW